VQELLLGLAVAAFTGGGLIFARRRTEAAALAERRLPADAPLGAVALAAPPASGDWRDGLDRKFGDLVEGTALDLDPLTAALLGMLLSVALAALFWFVGGQELWLIALGLAVGGVATFALLFALRNRKVQKMEEQLPDFLYFLARSMRSGQTLEQAFAYAAKENVPPLATEVRRTSQAMALGMPAPAALAQFAGRTPLPEVAMVRSAVQQHARGGGNLPLMLERIAAVARERGHQGKSLRAQTSMARASATFIALMQPAILLVYLVVKPEFIGDSLQSPAGWALVAVSTILEIVGVVWIWRLLRRS
jgi:tight adherence protein B